MNSPSRFRWLADILQPLDIITLGYILIVAVLILVSPSRVEHWPVYVLCHGGLVLFLVGFIRICAKTTSAMLRVIRQIYPLILFTFMFTEISKLVNIFFPFWLESHLLQWEMALFGVHSTVWVQGFFRPWLSELMAFSYWSYYILMPLGLVLLIRERDKKLFYSYIFNLSFTLYFCYLSYIFLTARGPHETIAALHIARETAGFFDGMVRSIQEQAGVSGAAFPSSHVSATIIILIYIFRYRQWAGWLALPLVLGLILSTFYLQYHYAVDAIAGALLVFITYPAGRALEEYLRRHFGHAADERRESVNIRTIS